MRAAADLPNAFVRPTPIVAHEVNETGEVQPEIVRDRLAELIIDVHRVHELAIDIQLQLVMSAVADADGTGLAVSFKMPQRRFLEVLPAVHRVHHLQWHMILEFSTTRFDPTHEG